MPSLSQFTKPGKQGLRLSDFTPPVSRETMPVPGLPDSFATTPVAETTRPNLPAFGRSRDFEQTAFRAPEGGTIEPTPQEIAGARTNLAQRVAGPEVMRKMGFRTGLAETATMGYGLPADIEQMREISSPGPRFAGQMIGMAPGIAGAGKLGIPARAAGAIQKAGLLGHGIRGTATGAVYGGLRNPGEGESRVGNLLTDAALFGVLEPAGALVGKGVKRLFRPPGMIDTKAQPMEGDFAPFKEPVKATEPAQAGKVTVYRGGKKGRFYTEDPGFASEYGKVTKSIIEPKNPLFATDISDAVEKLGIDRVKFNRLYNKAMQEHSGLEGAGHATRPVDDFILNEAKNQGYDYVNYSRTKEWQSTVEPPQKPAVAPKAEPAVGTGKGTAGTPGSQSAEQARESFQKAWAKQYGDRPTTIDIKKDKVPLSEPPKLTIEEARKIAKMSDVELAQYNAKPAVAPKADLAPAGIPTEKQLFEAGLFKPHFRDPNKWMVKPDINTTWKTITSSKEEAISRATEAYKKLAPEDRLLSDRMAKAELADDAKLIEKYQNVPIDEIKRRISENVDKMLKLNEKKAKIPISQQNSMRSAYLLQEIDGISIYNRELRNTILARDKAGTTKPAPVETPVAETPKVEIPAKSKPAILGKIDALEAEAKARLRKKGTRLTSGIDPSDLADYAIIGAAKIARGTVEFAQWSKAMIKEFGDTLTPHLRTIYEQAHKRLKGEVDSHLNLERMNLTPEARGKLESAIKDIKPELEAIKGETLTNAEVIEAAKTSDILQRVSTREQTLKSEAAALKARQHLTALAEGKEVTADFVKTLKIVSADATRKGRELQALGISADPNLGTIKTKIIKKMLEMGKTTDEIVEAAKGVDFTDANQVTNFYRKYIPATYSEMLDEYIYGNLLSSPRTHIVNTFSNILQVSVLRPGTRLVAGVSDAIASKLTGKTQKYYASQVPAYVKGYYDSIGDAIVKAGDAIKGKSLMGRPDIHRIPSNKKWLKGHQQITRVLEASDVFFRTLGEGGERAALIEGATKAGKPINETAIAKEAKAAAAESIFRKPLDPYNKSGQGAVLSYIDRGTNAIYHLRRIFPVKWFVRFLETPMNIFKQGIEYSPAGFSTMIKSTRKMEQFSKAMIGSMVFTGAGVLAIQDRTTWAIPRGKKEKEAFYDAGMQPYSIKLGDKWYQYNRLGPVGYPIAMAAAVKYYWEDDPASMSNDTIEKIGKTITGMAQFFSDQSYMQGIGDLVAAIGGEEGSIARALANMPSQLVPFVSFQRWVAQMIDPIYRKSERGFSIPAIAQALGKNIPGMSKSVDPYLETATDEQGVKRYVPAKRDYPVLQAFSPINISKARPENEPGLKMQRMIQGIGQMTRKATAETKDPKAQLYMQMVTAVRAGKLREFEGLKAELERLGYQYKESEYNKYFKMGAK